MRRMPWVQVLLVLCMAAFMLPYVPPVTFAIWAALTIAIEAGRAIYAREVILRTSRLDPRRAHVIMVFQAALAGAVVGCGAILFMPRLPLARHALYGAILFAIPAAGAMVSQASRFMVGAYSMCIVAPACVAWIDLHPNHALAITALAVFYCTMLVLAATDGDRLLARSTEIRHERDQLVWDLEKRNAEVRAAVARADEAAQARARVMAAASHDLRQPLHALSVYSAVLATNPPPESQRELATNIEQIVRSLGNLLHGLLDWSRLSSGHLVLDRRPVALDATVATVCAEFESAAAERGIELRRNLGSVVAIGDALTILRIARNLMDNALKYTEKGEITVSTAIDMRAGIPAAILRVTDTGHGIPADEQQKIFEEFYQIDNPGRDRNKGVGLGLAIVKRLCELGGGKVSVASEVGRGTTFEVCFPVGAQEQVSRAAARVEITDSLQGRRIYVVDDEPIITRGMHRLLADWGCFPSIANSLAEAERLFRERGIPDLLVTDLRLGENESGAAFAARMQRELGPFAVLVMTGETIPHARQETGRHGFVLLHKPIAAEKLREAMGELLSPQSKVTRGAVPSV